MKTEKRERYKYQMHLLLRLVKIYHGFAPELWWCVTAQAMLQVAGPFVNLYFSARILNELIGGRDAQRLGSYVLLTLICNLTVFLFSQGIGKINSVAQNKVMWKELRSVGDTFLKTDYENLGDAGYQNKKRYYLERRTMDGALCWGTIYNVQRMVKGICTIAASVVFAVPAFLDYGWGTSFFTSGLASLLMLLLLAGVLVCTVCLNCRQTEREMQFYKEFMEGNRSFAYYSGECTQYKYGKEIRLYGEEKLLLEGLKKSLDIDRLGKKGLLTGFYEMMKAGLGMLLSGCVYFFIGARAIAGAFGAGMIVQYVGAVTQFTGGFSEMAGGLAELRGETPFVENYLGILDSRPVKYQGSIPVEKRDDNEFEIEFRDVSFRYPGSSDWALRHFSLKLRIGEHLAVVGRNGSGKTTFIKLLCRLYDPTEGEILLNGIDIRKYNYEEYLELFSVVFQDFRLFSFSLGQNVAAAVDIDRERAASSLGQIGFGDRLKEMARGLDTPLYRDFDKDGVEISGGEAQKIALARALYKDAPFIILDEPTAALDPIAEYEIYSGFEKLVGGKSAVYISHRLSSCRFCDDIAVFEEGRLVQRGGHEELLAGEDSLYARLWNAQAQYYAEHTEEEDTLGMEPVYVS